MATNSTTECAVAERHEQRHDYYNHYDDYENYEGNAGKQTRVCNLFYCVRFRFIDAAGTAAASADIRLLASYAKRKSAADISATIDQLLPTHAKHPTADTKHGGLLSINADRASATAASSLTGSTSRANAFHKENQNDHNKIRRRQYLPPASRKQRRSRAPPLRPQNIRSAQTFLHRRNLSYGLGLIRHGRGIPLW